MVVVDSRAVDFIKRSPKRVFYEATRGPTEETAVASPISALLRERDQRADALVALDGMPKRQRRVDRVVVASASAVAHQITRLLELGHDPLDGALGDPDEIGDVA